MQEDSYKTIYDNPVSNGTIRYTLQGREEIKISIKDTKGKEASMILPIESTIQLLKKLRKRQLRKDNA